MNIFFKNLTVFITSFILILLTNSAQAQLNTLGGVHKTLSNAEKVVSNTSQLVSVIDGAVKEVKDKQLYKSLIDGKEFTLPVGILPGSGDKNYALILNQIFMTPEGLFAEIFMKIPIGGDGRALYFLADKVPFSRTGGIAGDLHLYLLKTDSITFGKERGYSVLFDGLEKGGTEKSCFVTFNCKGFKDLTLAGSVNFSKNSIVKDSKSNEQVSLKYYIQADKLSNFIIQVKDVPSFEFTNLPGYKCTVKELTVDRSEVKNAPEFKLPTWYRDSIRTVVNDPQLVVDGPDWEGVYIPEIVIELPKAFKEGDQKKEGKIVSKDLIIDQNGVTALNKAIDPIDGKIKGWSYSVKYIEVNLIASSLSKGAIEGEVSLPISKDDSKAAFGLVVSKPLTSKDLSYKGYIESKTNGGLLNAEAFGVAKIKLDDSRFEFEYKNDQFYPAAILNGSITLTPKKDTSNTNSKSIGSFGLQFEKLRLTSDKPYLAIDSNGFVQMTSQGSMFSNFPVSIKRPKFVFETGGQRAGIQMTLEVKLQKTGDGTSQSSNGFGGTTTFIIWAKRDAIAQKWKFDGVKMNEITVSVDNGSFKLYGQLATFNDDKAYGTGFCGYLKLIVVDKIHVEASAIFGRYSPVNEDIDPENPPTDASLQDSDSKYRYWFVDAGVYFPPIMIAPFVGISGFTGGLYHNMRMQKEPDPKYKTEVNCQTATGFTYVPDNTLHLGLMAGVGLQSIPTASVFNGKVTLGLEFNKTGGLNMVALWGGVIFLTPEVPLPDTESLKKTTEVKKGIDKYDIKQKEPDPESGALRVTWFTQYDVPAKTFVGDFDIYINYAGVVKGVSEPSNNKAGHIAVLFSPEADYVYIGLPVRPLAIEVINLFTASGYFCAGSTLPNPPIAPLPSEVGAIPIDYNALKTGAGLSFGVRVGVEKKFGGDADFLGCEVWVGAQVWAKAGFDILISKSQHPVECSGYGERGINNWYATGQAFITGGLKLTADYDCGILGSNTLDLLSASITASLFAQLPKPSYLRGTAGITFKILSIGGSANIKIELGQLCRVSDADKNIVFISSIQPASGNTDVMVTEKIIVTFAQPIERFEFNLPDESGSGTLPYRAIVNNSNVIVSHNGNPIPCTYEWNNIKTVLRLSPLSVLPENAEIKVDVEVVLQYNKNGSWINSSKTEKRSITFRTATELPSTDVANIAYAYPLPKMNNYYRMESNTGYIKLATLPNKPMKVAPGYAFHVVFESDGGEVARVTNVTVNNQPGVEQFQYTIPNEKLQNNTRYKLKLVKALESVQKKEKVVEDYNMGYVYQAKDSTILEYTFQTSRFSSFAQKIAFYNVSQVEVSGSSVTHTLSPNSKDKDLMTAEGFTSDETSGRMVGDILSSEPLVRSLGADFTSGFSASGANPELVTYSAYGGKLVVQYNVFDGIQTSNKEKKLTNIVCSIDQMQSCEQSGRSYSFPKGGKYFYKLGYFLPGRDVKTSEVSLSFDLPQDINIAY
ncbi:MAG TPA: hypothetical protein VIK89_06865 [Cytophagaceae bacterium]